MKKIWILGYLIGVSFFVSCQQQEQETTVEPKATKGWQPEVMKQSELAILMREMHDQSASFKLKINEGEMPEKFPEHFKNIHTANSTDPDVKDEVYHSFSDMYLGFIKQYEEAEGDAKVIQYNNSIKACVSCHQQYCQGPIPKIEKLYIK